MRDNRFEFPIVNVLLEWIGGRIGRKVYLLMPFAPILSLPLVQSCVSSEYLVNAIFAKAWAAAVIIYSSYNCYQSECKLSIELIVVEQSIH